MIYGGKTVILVKYPFRHNTSSTRSKNWRDSRNEAIQPFLSFKPHSYTQREKFSSSKLQLSLSDRIIIGGYAFSFQSKSSLLADETICRAHHRYITRQHVS